jgi:hypothetical protein
MNKQILKMLFFACLIVFTSVSCEVDEIDDTTIDNQDPTTPEEGFKNLEVTNSFKWTTSNDYKINFQGLPVSTANVKMPLVIKIQDGDVLRKVNISISEDVEIDVNVPSRFQTLELSWGTFEKTLTLGDNANIDFTFIEVNPVEEEEEEE